MADFEEAGYYEVQLNNKQLVFFFMAAVAISVVVFLCGVMVGRGVREATIAAIQPNIVAGMGGAGVLEPAPAAQPPQSRLDYQERLEGDGTEVTLRSTSPEAQVKKASTEPKPPPKKPAPARARSRPEILGKLSGTYTVQVVALKTADAARKLLDRLQSKRYRAYLEDGGDAGLHRVRVGKFDTRAEAERVAQKLRTEEKFKPYITQ